MIKDCDDCESKIKCVECDIQLCNKKDDYNCFIEGHYACPQLGIVCIECKDKVKFNEKC